MRVSVSERRNINISSVPFLLRQHNNTSTTPKSPETERAVPLLSSIVSTSFRLLNYIMSHRLPSLPAEPALSAAGASSAEPVLAASAAEANPALDAEAPAGVDTPGAEGFASTTVVAAGDAALDEPATAGDRARDGRTD